MKIIVPYQKLLACLTLGCLLSSTIAQAKNGATDAIPGTSNGASKSGGGGKKGSVVTTPVPTAPVQPIVTGTLTLTSNSYNGSTPNCGGSYHIDPYYPTLSLLTVDVSVDSLNTPDGSPLFIVVNGAGGTFYPYLGGTFTVTGGGGSGSYQIYCTPGSSIASVSILDVTGNVVATGK